MNDEIAQGAGEDAGGHDARRAARRHQRLSRQGARLHQVRRHRATSPARRSSASRPRRRSVMVEEAHKRGKKWPRRTPPPPTACACRSTPASISFSIPRCSAPREMPDDAGQDDRRTADRSARCWSTRSPARRGPKHLKDRERGGEEAVPRTQPRRPAAREDVGRTAQARPPTPASELEMRRKNAQKLIAAGAVVTLGHRQLLGRGAGARRARRSPRRRTTASARSSAIEGLVELGMTPMQAIVAATKNGALAAGRSADLGHDRGRQDRRPAGARRRVRSPTSRTSAPSAR